MIKELLKLTTEAESDFGAEFAENLLAALENRIIERRNHKLSTLLAYLQDVTFLDATADLHLTYASRKEMADEARKVYARLYPEPESKGDTDNPTEVNPDEPEVIGPTPPKRSRSRGQDLRGHLKDNKNKRAERGALMSSTPLFKIQKAMGTYEATGKRPEILQQVSY